MTLYKNLLCPVDFSDLSRHALAWALEFGAAVGCDVTPFHTIDTALTNVGNLVAVPNDGAERQRTEASKLLQTWAVELNAPDTRVLVTQGVPSDAIASATKGDDVDLLVMGTHGLSGIQKLLLGSVMEKVLHRIHKPLLAIPPKAMAFSVPRTILLAVDLDSDTSAAARHGISLAEHFGAKLVVAHAIPEPYYVLNDHSIERLTADQLQSLEAGLTSERRKELEGLVASTSAETDVVVHIDSPFQTLRRVMEERTPELVVMGAGGHRESGWDWVGSTCHKMVRAASYPVLIVR